LTLAVCIGANVALFSVVRGVLFKPLALPDAERVVIAGNVYPGAGVHDPIGAAVPDYFDRLRDITTFSDQALFKRVDPGIDQGGGGGSRRSDVGDPILLSSRLPSSPQAWTHLFGRRKKKSGTTPSSCSAMAFWHTQFGADKNGHRTRASPRWAAAHRHRRHAPRLQTN
jgi:hypothetical protein